MQTLSNGGTTVSIRGVKICPVIKVQQNLSCDIEQHWIFCERKEWRFYTSLLLQIIISTFLLAYNFNEICGRSPLLCTSTWQFVGVLNISWWKFGHCDKWLIIFVSVLVSWLLWWTFNPVVITDSHFLLDGHIVARTLHLVCVR